MPDPTPTPTKKRRRSGPTVPQAQRHTEALGLQAPPGTKLALATLAARWGCSQGAAVARLAAAELARSAEGG